MNQLETLRSIINKYNSANSDGAGLENEFNQKENEFRTEENIIADYSDKKCGKINFATSK